MKKKFISICYFLFLISSIFCVEFKLRLFPVLEVPLETKFDFIAGGAGSVDILPFTVRGRDDIYLSFQGGYSQILSSVDPEPCIEIDGAIGYNFRLSDRFSLLGEVFSGVYILPDYKLDEVTTIDGLSGISVGGRLSGNFYISPAFEASVYGGYKYYHYDPVLFNTIQFGVGITYNFTKGIFGVSNVDVTSFDADPIFPIFYSRYDDHEFGEIHFINSEKNDITDVQVTLFIEQYMSNPKVIFEQAVVKRGEEVTSNLTAFLNETILNLLQNQMVSAQIQIKYRSLGKYSVKEQNMELQTLTRNSMTWEDDRRASAFVSGRDSSAQLFARQMEATIRKQLSDNVPLNLQYAAGVFAGLKAFGINYVIDPSSAYTDNTGTSSVDFLQYPYQTLLYHGGDCDDLSILNCSLLEALGVDTAFITVPGHIYMAFDAGVPVEEAGKINKGRTIVAYDKVWIPVEITVTQDTFGLALRTGYNEWKKYESEAMIIPLSEGWKEYSPVSIPESDVLIEMPKTEILLKEFKAAMNYVK